MDVLSQLRLKRAEYGNVVTEEDLVRCRTSKDQLLFNSRQQFDDATAVFDLAPGHSTPEMVRCARANRMAAVNHLSSDLKYVNIIGREKKIALEDSRIQLADHGATAEQKAFAAKIAADLKDVVSTVCS